MAKIQLTRREKVVYILHLARGDWLSCQDIQDKFEERYSSKIKKETIRSIIRTHNYLGGNISEYVERRGIKKQPVRVFTIFPEENQLQ